MHSYQIIVSTNGRFMFRTEWDSDKSRVYDNSTKLQSSLPHCKVDIVFRNNVHTYIDIDELSGQA